MRFIYLDEAGTAAHEPVTVVSGVIVHADTQFVALESALSKAFEAVPEPFRDGFHFHAKDIWGSHKYRDVWSVPDRLSFLKSVMAIPIQLNVPIALGMVRRSAKVPRSKYRPEQFHHLMAFDMFVSRCDRYLRWATQPGEVATIIAEDVPELKRELQSTLNSLRKPDAKLNYQLDNGDLIPSQEELNRGVNHQVQESWVERIRHSVLFEPKTEGSILQIADACCYAFREFFSGKPNGADFVEALIGQRLVEEDWTGPISGSVFSRPNFAKPRSQFLRFIRFVPPAPLCEMYPEASFAHPFEMPTSGKDAP